MVPANTFGKAYQIVIAILLFIMTYAHFNLLSTYVKRKVERIFRGHVILIDLHVERLIKIHRIVRFDMLGDVMVKDVVDNVCGKHSNYDYNNLVDVRSAEAKS